MRAKSELRANIRKNAPISPGIFYDTTVCRNDGIKITDLEGEIIRKKSSHKYLKFFLCDRDITQQLEII